MESRGRGRMRVGRWTQVEGIDRLTPRVGIRTARQGHPGIERISEKPEEANGRAAGGGKGNRGTMSWRESKEKED
eukprot:1261337-Pyramimonas_sp.AAC.1